MKTEKELIIELGELQRAYTLLDKSEENIKREIEEAKATLEKYNAQLAGEIEKEAQFIKEVPQQAKDMEQMLIEKWDESDMHRR